MKDREQKGKSTSEGTKPNSQKSTAKQGDQADHKGSKSSQQDKLSRSPVNKSEGQNSGKDKDNDKDSSQRRSNQGDDDRDHKKTSGDAGNKGSGKR